MQGVAETSAIGWIAKQMIIALVDSSRSLCFACERTNDTLSHASYVKCRRVCASNLFPGLAPIQLFSLDASLGTLGTSVFLGLQLFMMERLQASAPSSGKASMSIVLNFVE